MHERFSNWPQFVMRDFETRKWVLIIKEFLNVFQELWCGLNVRLFRRYLHHPVPQWAVPLSLMNEQVKSDKQNCSLSFIQRVG